MTSNTHPLPWIQNVEAALQCSGEIPLWGYSPSFDPTVWEEKISSFLNLPRLKIAIEKTRSLSPDQFVADLGTSPFPLPLQLSSLPSSFHFLMGAEDIGVLARTLLSPKALSKGLFSPGFVEGFYRYILLQLLQFLSGEDAEIKPWGDLLLKIAAPTPLPIEESLCIDLSFSLPHEQILGRLILPSAFVLHFKEHFQIPSKTISKNRAEKIPLSLSCQIGATTLSLEAWNYIKVGDCILLDRCTYDPKTHKGSGFLSLNEIPLLRVRLKENQIKIVDYAFYHEEFMDPVTPDSTSEEQEPLENSEASTESSPEQILQKEKIPLTLSVEVARLQMDLSKLLELTPGNTLELGVRPEQGVSLLVNGKKVAQGELVKMGDTLGVKILKTGQG